MSIPTVKRPRLNYSDEDVESLRMLLTLGISFRSREKLRDISWFLPVASFSFFLY